MSFHRVLSIVLLLSSIFSATIVHANQAVALVTVEVTPVSNDVSIPRGAQRVPMLTLMLSSTCDASAQISSVTLKRIGRGNATDILRVYALEGNIRRSRPAVISSSEGSVQIRLDRFFVLACSSRTLRFVADFSPTAEVSGEHRLTLEQVNDIDANGATLRTSDEANASELEREQRIAAGDFGSIVVTYLALPRDPLYGSRRVVARVRLAADARDHHQIEAITFTNDGSASDVDLRNLFLETSAGKRLSVPAPKLDDNHVRISIDPPLLLSKNDDVTLVLRADIRASRRKTIRLLIEEAGDIEAEVVRGRRVR